MRRSKGSPGRDRRLRASGPLTLVSVIGLVLSIWMGRAPPGPLQNLDLPGTGGTRTIGSPPVVVIPSRSVTRPPRSSTPGTALGTLEIRVEDTTQQRRGGVLVRIDGPRSGTVLTERDGVALLAGLEPGRYDVEVPAGCIRDLEIFQGRRGTAEVFAGRTSIIRLGNVEARARFWPARPVRWSAPPAWRVGDRVTITFSVIDRCRGEDAGGGTSFARLRWTPNEVISMVGRAPTKAEDDGSATITFRCAREGVPRLLLLDPETGEQQDLLELSPGIGLTPACS